MKRVHKFDNWQFKKVWNFKILFLEWSTAVLVLLYLMVFTVLFCNIIRGSKVALLALSQEMSELVR